MKPELLSQFTSRSSGKNKRLLPLGWLILAVTSTFAQHLSQSSFHFPGDGRANNNQSIGPFCCTGETATVRTTDNKNVGYIYFYSWEGQAITNGGHSYVPDVDILVSGTADPRKPESEQLKNALSFKSSEMTPGATATSKAGMLSFTATIENAKLQTIDGETFAEMGSIVVVVAVAIASPQSSENAQGARSCLGGMDNGSGSNLYCSGASAFQSHVRKMLWAAEVVHDGSEIP